MMMHEHEEIKALVGEIYIVSVGEMMTTKLPAQCIENVFRSKLLRHFADSFDQMMEGLVFDYACKGKPGWPAVPKENAHLPEVTFQFSVGVNPAWIHPPEEVRGITRMQRLGVGVADYPASKQEPDMVLSHADTPKGKLAFLQVTETGEAKARSREDGNLHLARNLSIGCLVGAIWHHKGRPMFSTAGGDPTIPRC